MPANFRIGDTAEIEILKQEVIESIFEEKYENNDKEFLDLIRKYTTYSDDQNLKDLIIKIYEYSRCTPNPKKWIRESAEDFNFEEKIKNEEKFLLYIKSEGCSVCEADFPKVKEITDKNNYLSYYIQADEMAEAVGQLNLYTAPVVILFYNGKEIHRQARFIDFSELDYRIKQTL